MKRGYFVWGTMAKLLARVTVRTPLFAISPLKLHESQIQTCPSSAGTMRENSGVEVRRFENGEWSSWGGAASPTPHQQWVWGSEFGAFWL